MQKYGITSFALSEQKLDDLLREGIAKPAYSLNLRGTIRELCQTLPPSTLPKPNAGKLYLVFTNPSRANEIAAALNNGFGSHTARFWYKNSQLTVLELSLTLRQLQNTGLGFSWRQAAELADRGARIWIRPENKLDTSPQAIKRRFATFKRLPHVTGVIFAGLSNEVVGYPNALQTTAHELKTSGWYLGLIELSPRAQQKGALTLARSLIHHTVRLQAVPPGQQIRLTPIRVAQMYSLGVRERNIRAIYLRPYLTHTLAGTEPELNRLLFQSVNNALKNRVGEAEAFPDLSAPGRITYLLIALATCAAFYLFLNCLVPTPFLFALILMGGALIGSLLLTGPKFILWKQLIALSAACIFPLLSLTTHFAHLRKLSKTPSRRVILPALILLVRISAFSLLGALFAAALLDDTTFMLGIDRFRGVKLLALGVPALTGILWVLTYQGKNGLKKIYNQPLTLGNLLGALLILGVAAFYLLRTGNKGAEVLSSWLQYEKLLRVYLDSSLGVRPRFKEFLLAHPALILTPILLSTGKKNWAWLTITLAALGQAGMVDTFAHIHTPLYISIVRTILGLICGSILGLIYTAAYLGFNRIWKRYHGAWINILSSASGPVPPDDRKQIIE